MATIGGFVAGPRAIINYLRYNLRSQIYAKSLPMPIVEGALKRLEIIRGKEGARLRENSAVTRALQEAVRKEVSTSVKRRHVLPRVYGGWQLSTCYKHRD